jgi:hypothetical protein
MGNKENPHMLVGTPEVKRPQGRPRHRWVGNVKNLEKIGRNGVDAIDLA